MLILSEQAAIKYDYIRNNCNTGVISEEKNSSFLEVSLMGISDPDQINKIVDWYIPKQEVSAGTTDFDDDAWTDYIESITFGYLDENPDDYEGASFAVKRHTRVWAHTHPGDSATPSGTDEETFRDFFGEQDIDFAAMLILAKGNKTTNRMKYNSSVGIKTHEEPVYVVNALNKYVLLEKYIDELRRIEAAAKAASDAGFEISLNDHNAYPDFSEHYEAWLTELTERVTQKKYGGGSNSNTPGFHQGGTQTTTTTATSGTKAPSEVEELLRNKAKLWIV